MTSRGGNASLAFEAAGSGVPLLALHGAYASRGEVHAFLEPMVGARAVRRLYVDLPGHGDSRPSSGFRRPDDVLDAVDRLIDAECGGRPFLLLGHSYGGHVARAVAARHPDRVAGMALVCTVVPGELRPAPSGVVRDDGVAAQLDDDQRAGYEAYFVVRTAATLERFRTVVLPAGGDVDVETLERAIATGPHAVDPDDVTIDAPVLVVSGRDDSWVGWQRQERLGDQYPHATVVTVADTGHALPHERPELVAALDGDWLDRVGV